MIARVITTILVLLGITAGGYGVVKYEASKNSTASTPEVVALTTAWIEIEQGAVFLHGAGQGTPLKSGDTVKAGDTLETGKNTEAVIHFPDGSVLRVDKETNLTLDNFSYTPTDKSLVVEVKLISGRLWSKVVGLATPASHWEVKTSNTVATVRGTAFGIGYKNNKSWILGSEHTVSVAPLDPKTNTPLTGAAVDVSEKAYIEIGNKEIELARATTSPVLKSRISTTTNPIENDIWIKKVKVDDDDLNKEIEIVKQGAQNKDEKTWRTILEQKVTENLYKVAPQKKMESSQDNNESRIKERSDDYKDLKKDQSDSSKEVLSKPTNTSIEKPEDHSIIQKPIQFSSTKTVPPELQSIKNIIGSTTIDTGLSVTLRRGRNGIEIDLIGADNYPVNYLPIREGERINLIARMSTSDFMIDSYDVTNNSTFTVLGGIGSMQGSIFVAKLSDDISENGVGYGAIIATYKDPKTGKATVSRSALIQVKSSAESKPEDIGGQ